MNEKRPNRSAAYQYLFAEIACDIQILEAIPNDDSIYKRLNPFAYNEDIAILEEELKVEFWRVVDELLTDRQRKVLKLLSEGKTQVEAAKELDINQSSVTKSLHGNVSYEKGKNKISYGGSKRKLQKIIETDERIKDILKKISDLRQESWI